MHSQITTRSVGQGVKTPPFHGGITGSIPVRSTLKPAPSAGFTLERPKKRPSNNSLFADWKQSKQVSMQSVLCKYKPAQIYAGSSCWYIFYYYIHPQTGKWQRFKEYFDVNRIRDRKEKRIYAEEVVKFINLKLLQGFNPFEATVRKEAGGTILQLLDVLFAEICKNANKSMVSYYLTIMNRLRLFLTEKEYTRISLSHIDSLVAESFKDWMLEKQLSKKSINVTLSHLSMFWKKALKMGLVFADPFAGVDKVRKDLSAKESDEDHFEPLTFEELKAVMEAASANYKRFLLIIYYAWARPVEIKRLRIKNINKESAFIKFISGATKNEQGAFVQIVNPLMDVLNQIDFTKYKPDDYLFGNDFLPGPKPMHRLKANLEWSKVAAAAGTNKKMYALKHTGNIEYLLQNKGKADLKWQQMQNRHKTSAMTDRYNRKLGAYFINTDDVKWRAL